MTSRPQKPAAPQARVGPPVSWEEIRFFLAAARRGSLNSAAEEAGVDHTTLSRRLTGLERRLGVRLLQRGPTGLRLTGDGKAALIEAEQMEAAARRFVGGSAGNDSRLAGTVRISMTEGLASHWLVPRLPALSEKYPEIGIVIESSNTATELNPDTDISIRYAAPTSNLDYLVARRGPTLHFALFGTRAYTDRYGLPKSILELGQHSYIDHTVQHQAPSLGPWYAMLASLTVKLRVANYIAALSAMNEGIGLSLQPVYATSMAPHLIAAEINLGLQAETWVVYHSDRRAVARVRLIADEIVAMGLRDQRSFFDFGNV